MKPTERVTLRLSREDLAMIDTFVQAGESSNRSDVIRRALKAYFRKEYGTLKENITALTESQKAYLELQGLQEEVSKLSAKLQNITRK